MTGPRFQTHPDGLWAVRYLDGADWHLYDPEGRRLGTIADSHLEGWREAVLVVLPEPDGTAKPYSAYVHDPPESPYWTLGNGGRLHARDAGGLLYENEVSDDDVLAVLEHDALAMLAAARWTTGGGAT